MRESRRNNQARGDRPRKTLLTGEKGKMRQSEQIITKLWREDFEARLPDLLEEAEAKLREDFEATSLPGLLEEAEEKLREDFEEELQENLDKIDPIEKEAMEAFALAWANAAREDLKGRTVE